VKLSPQHGISLKATHYEELLQRNLGPGWAEAITENFLGRGGRPLAVLERVRRDREIILHGVSMSLGGPDPFDPAYFRSLRELRSRIEAAFVGDHLSFGTFDGHFGHDLWPLPRTEEAVRHLAARIRQAQDMLEEQLVIENVSAYVDYAQSRLGEAEFMTLVLQEADAAMLLDVNNVFVSAHNLGFDAWSYIDAIPAERVRYFHLAGHSEMGPLLLDDHGSAVGDATWELYEYAVARIGGRPTIVEWDSNLPALDRLLAESEHACDRANRISAEAAA